MKIVVAGGCFWGVEEYYRRIKGIINTRVGYINSTKDSVNYEEVCSQKYEAIEAVELEYDNNVINLEKILELLFRIIDPTSLDKQGGDIGHSYRVGAYYRNDDEANIIENYINKEQEKYSAKIVFENLPLKSFIDAEEYHQMYLVKNPTGYCHVNFSKIRADELK